MKSLPQSLRLFGWPVLPELRAASVELWLTPARFAVLLGVFILAAYPDVVMGSRSFFYRDFGLFGYPLAYHYRTSFWQGELPLWNPLNNCGLPFMAQWNTMVFYPLSLFYVFLPLPWALNYFCLGHLFLAGFTMFLLAQRWTGSRLGAGVAGIGYALNGLTLHSLMWPNNIAALAWMPLVVLLVERAWTEGGRAILWAAIPAAVQMLAGAPEIILFTWLILAAMGVGKSFFTWRRCSSNHQAGGTTSPVWPLVYRAVAVIVLVGGLAAVQLLPFLDLLRHSQRDASFGQSAWPMPGWGWANFLVPLFHCSISIAGVYSQNEQQWTSSYYLGIGTVALALCAAWKCRRRRVWFLSGITLFSLVMALGEHGHLFVWIKQLFPVVGVARFPIKFVVLAAFALPLLAAFGLEKAMDPTHRTTLKLIGTVLMLLIGGLIWFASAYPWPDENIRAVTRSGLSRAGLLTGLLVLLLGWRWLSARLPSWSLALALLLLLGVDPLTHAPRQNPTVDTWVYDPALNQFQTKPGSLARAMVSPGFQAFLEYAATPDPAQYCLGHRGALLANWNLLAGVPVVNGFYSLYAREQREIWSLLYGRSKQFPEPLADFLGVTQISAGTEFAWSQRPNALPLVTAGQRPIYGDRTFVLAGVAAPEFKPAEIVYLPAEARSSLKVAAAAHAQVLSMTRSAHTLAAEIVTDAPALVTIAQTGYHWWRASVDGQPARIWPANHAFQALEIPAGRHVVRLVYRDLAFQWGAIISILTILICAASWCRLRRPVSRVPSPGERCGDHSMCTSPREGTRPTTSDSRE